MIQTLEGYEGLSHEGIVGERVPGRGVSKGKDPEAGTGLTVRNSGEPVQLGQVNSAKSVGEEAERKGVVF